MSTFRASWKTQIIRELLLKRYLGCPGPARSYGLSLSPAWLTDRVPPKFVPKMPSKKK
jgi:hypothetical protein